MHYYRFNIGDYASHAGWLTPVMDCAYRRLIDFYYLHERPPTGPVDEIALEIRMPDHVREVEIVLRKFFDLDGENWVHHRIENDIKVFRRVKKARSKAGKASAQARRDAGSEQVLNFVELTNNQKPITNNQCPPYNPPGGGELSLVGGDAIDTDDLFNRFWEAYPRKVGKAAAQKAFAKLDPGVDGRNQFATFVDLLVKDVEARKSASWGSGEKKYIPHPSTYLNGRRWEDEIEKGGGDSRVTRNINATLAWLEDQQQNSN